MRRGLLLISLGLMAMIAASCNIVAPAVLLANGPEKTKAVFELPEERPTLVFVDDRDNRLPRRSLRQAISDAAQDMLMSDKAVKPEHMIDAKVIPTIVARESSTEPMDIQTIARQAQAQIVIYIVPASFRLSNDGQTYEPGADFYVKVLDITLDKPRIWPEEPEGKLIPVVARFKSTDLPSRPAELLLAEDALAAESGRVIAELFFSHEARRRVDEGRPK